MPIEIISFPINIVIFHSYLKLPQGTQPLVFDDFRVRSAAMNRVYDQVASTLHRREEHTKKHRGPRVLSTVPNKKLEPKAW